MLTPSFSLTATERVLPRLALDFTTATLDPRVTFTRSGNTATVISSSGLVSSINADLPRFNYDPISLACKGLLIEETRTNLITYSEDLGDLSWTKTGTTVSTNVTTSPDGTANADKILETSATSTHLTFPAVTAVTSGVSYTGVYYFKADENTFIQLTFSTTQFGSGQYANFNLSTGSVTAESGGVAKISNAGNGWYRCSFTATCSTSGNATCFPVLIRSALIGRLPSYAGDASRGLYAWGAQLEAGAFATSYIPTTATTVTRNADVATMTGTDFSDWYSAGAGGLAALVLPSTVSGTRPAIQFDDNTTDEIIALRGDTTNPELVIVEGGAPQAQIDAGTITENAVYNLGAAWATDDCAAAVNGGAAVTDTTATIPTVTQARLGSDGTNYLNGHLQSIRYWPQRIIDAEVRAFSK